MSQLFVSRRSDLGIAEDTRRVLERLRRREIWAKFHAANLPYPPQATKEELIKIAVKKNLDLEKAPMSTAPIITEDLSIHDLRRQVAGLTKADGEKWAWDEVKKFSKEQLRGILNGNDPAARG